MAGVGRGWTKALAVAVLLMGAAGVCFAQSDPSPQSGSLAGKLTDLHSKPLEGVSLRARNQDSGAEARTTTTKNGSYLFNDLAPGAYTLTAESAQLGRAQVEEIVVDAGHETRVQTAMEFVPPAPESILAALRKLSRPDPDTVAPGPGDPPVSDVVFTAEPLRMLPLSGRRMNFPREMPATVALELKVTLAAEPLRMLDLVGRSLSNFVPQTLISQLPQCEGSGAPGTCGAANGSLIARMRPEDSPAPATGATSAADLQALPVSGRRWQDFVLDNAPTSARPAGGEGQISLGGAGQSAEIAVDGVGLGLAFGRTEGSGQGSSGRGALGEGENPAGMAQVGSGGHGMAVSEAAIRAVQTAAESVEAAAERAAGGRMNVATQSGSNELHGQGFLLDRQNDWGAKNPFTQRVTKAKPAVLSYNPSGPPLSVPVFTPEPYTPADLETTWGIGLGSRIRRDKLFWFAAVDAYNRNDPGVATVKHPYLNGSLNNSGQDTPTGFFATPSYCDLVTLAGRLGFTAGEPTDCVSGLVDGLTAYSSMLETLGGLLGPTPRTAQQDTGFGRLDWKTSERHSFTLEGIGARWNAPGGGLTRVEENYGNHSFGESKAGEEWLLGRWEAFVTPNLLAVTQASFGHSKLQARPSTPSTYEKTLLAGNAWGQLPQIVVDNRDGFTIGNPARFGQGSYPDERAYQTEGKVDWIRGKLLVRAGLDFNHNFNATGLLRNRTGTYTYATVENFISDALVVGQYGLSGVLNPGNNLYGCDQTGKVWTDPTGTVRGLGNLPCYAYYSQMIGPANWHFSTNDWAGYTTAQWQPTKQVVVSAGLRWEREQLPPPITAVGNPQLPLTERLPDLGNEWAPRVSLAVGTGEQHWPVLRLGYGMYYGRTPNATVETALTQTGSTNGDMNFFMRPTDDLPNNGGGAPPFPYVLRGAPGSAIKPGAMEFAPNFHNPEIHQAVVAVEETLPGHVEVTASAMVSLGRRLPISIDTNLAPLTLTQSITYDVCDQTIPDPKSTSCGHIGLGPIKSKQITVPFYALWSASAGRLNPDYQQIDQIESMANSTYEAWTMRVARYSRRGLSLRAHYTYAHATDWNPNESAQAAGNDVLDPAHFSLEYGTGSLDQRHSVAAMAIYEAPWKLRGRAGKFGNGWMLAGVFQARSGLPYTMRTSGSLAETFDGNTAIVGVGPGMNGSGGDNRVYGVGNDGAPLSIGRNTYRYPATWKADLRLGRRFDLGHMRQLELLAESFNLLNHQNVTEVETTGYTIESGTPPRLNFLTGLKANTTAFGQPLNINATNFYRERQIQFGLRMRF